MTGESIDAFGFKLLFPTHDQVGTNTKASSSVAG
jgi:hypothetical protein